jgi:hypothetical protein
MLRTTKEPRNDPPDPKHNGRSNLRADMPLSPNKRFFGAERRCRCTVSAYGGWLICDRTTAALCNCAAEFLLMTQKGH